MAESLPYFGYGSNLDADDWKEWCERKGYDHVEMVEIGNAYLIGYQMKFHYYSNNRKGGAADVVLADATAEVPGALFILNNEAWEAMDRKEGYPSYYKKKYVTVRTSDGETKAITYTVVEGKILDRYQKPTPEYEALIRNGLKRRNLPTSALDAALE
ncbi:MAG: hypothetical protein CMB65_04910 [Euryarchaeota archaeon]|nr:hypothetical protein [Euryarchaeota archaeon]